MNTKTTSSSLFSMGMSCRLCSWASNDAHDLTKSTSRNIILKKSQKYRSFALVFICILLNGVVTATSTSTSYSVILELVGRPAQVNVAQIAAIEQNFIKAYSNAELSARILGTATFHREIDGAVIVNNGSQDSIFAFDIMFTCRGCVQNETVFSNGEKRMLQSNSLTEDTLVDELNTTQPFTLLIQVNTTCDGCEPRGHQSLFSNSSTNAGSFFSSYSPWYGPRTDNIAYRFNHFLAANADSFPAIDKLSAVNEVENVDCSSEVIVIERDLVVDFLGDPQQVTEDDLILLAEGFQDTFNFLNSLNADRCDPFFRRIEEVVVDTTTTQSRRSLQVVDNTSSSLHIFPGFNATETNSELTFFSFFFRVKFNCRGCETDSDLLSDIISPDSNSRRLSNENDEHRFLQATQAAPACVCPINPTELRSPSHDEFVTLYRKLLRIRSTQGHLNSLADIQDVFEVAPVPCSSEVTLRSAFVEINVTGNPNDFTGDAAAAELAFVQSYNDLAEKSCDPFFRTVVNASLVSVLVLDDQPTRNRDRRKLREGDRFDFVKPLPLLLGYDTVYDCRGCGGGKDVGLFGNDASRRDLMRVPTAKERPSGQRRILQDADTCFCATNATSIDAPTVIEFGARFNRSSAFFLISTECRGCQVSNDTFF